MDPQLTRWKYGRCDLIFANIDNDGCHMQYAKRNHCQENMHHKQSFGHLLHTFLFEYDVPYLEILRLEYFIIAYMYQGDCRNDWT